MYRIQFKLAVVMFTIHTRRCPDYLGDSMQACNSDPARTCLRSASYSDYSVLRTRTKFGDRAFSVAGPVYGTVYQQQFVKLTACIRSDASSKCHFHSPVAFSCTFHAFLFSSEKKIILSGVISNTVSFCISVSQSDH